MSEPEPQYDVVWNGTHGDRNADLLMVVDAPAPRAAPTSLVRLARGRTGPVPLPAADERAGDEDEFEIFG